MKYSIIFIAILGLMLQGYVLGEEKIPTPATRAEFLQDMHRYVQLLGSPNVFTSLDALEYLFVIGKPAVPALLKGLKNPNPNIRGWSSVALGYIQDPRAIEPLIALLEDTGNITVQVLSDDARRIQHCYGAPLKRWVQRKALYALMHLTGKNFGNVIGQKKEKIKKIQNLWRQWWQKNKSSFQTKKRPNRFLNDFPSPEIQYPKIPYAIYLKGVKICLDPGHGGQAHRIGYKRGFTGLREAEINLRVARFLRNFLEQVGAEVIMTRDSDKDIGLKERAEIANYHQADLFISIHHNWSPRYTSKATTIWYHRRPDHSPSSMDLARYLFHGFTTTIQHGELDQSIGLKSDQLMYQSGFGVLRNLSPQVSGALVELSFFSNYNQELKLRTLSFLKKEAYGLYLGLARYLYHGIPHWKVIHPKNKRLETQTPTFKIKIQDGLENRKMWGYQRIKIFSRQLVITLNNNPIPYQYDPKKGILTFTQTLKPGQYKLQLWFNNINKNSNWPKIYTFKILKKQE